MPKGQKKTKTQVELDKEKKERRDRFVKVGGHRVQKATDAIGALHALANRKSYEFDETDISKIRAALTSEVDAAIIRLQNASKGGATAKPVFKF